MSRIGKAPITVPAGVSIQVKDNVVTVKGPKGELSQEVNPEITVNVEEGQIELTRPSDAREHRSLHGLYRALINNMVVGVSEGYKKEMELVSLLVYFTRLSKNESWYCPEEKYLKAYLKQYKGYKYPNNISNVYPEFYY